MPSVPDTPPQECTPRPADFAVQRPKKKNVKIWFSPRSRKVRCQVESAGEGTGPKKATVEPPSDLSVYNFTSSSQDSGDGGSSGGAEDGGGGGKKRAPRGKRKRPPASPRPATRRQTKMAAKKEKLAAINKEWGFSDIEGAVARDGEEEEEEEEEQQQEGRSKDRPSRRVSFQIVGAPSGGVDAPLQRDPPDDTPPPTPNEDVLEAGSTSEAEPDAEEASTVQKRKASPSRVRKPAAKTADPLVRSPKRTPSPSARRPSKGSLPPEGAQPESTPKRRKPSPGRGRRSEAPTPPSTRPSPVFGSPARRSPKEQGKPSGSPRTPQRGSPGAPSPLRGRLSQGSPAYLKRNHKGETPLHLAAIKVQRARCVCASAG